MSQIMKAFTGVFMVLFMTLSATGILDVFFETMQAQNLHAVIVSELEDSDYSIAVLEDAFVTAKECGYKLRVLLYPEYEAAVCCTCIEDIPEDLEDMAMAEVTLQYAVDIPFFGVYGQQNIIGYAR